MMSLYLMLLACTAGVLARGSCTYDNATPSPTDIDTDYCSSFVTDHCASITNLEPEKVTAYCECLLASETGTVTPVGNSTQTTETGTTSRETQAPATPIISTSSPLSATETSSSQLSTAETDASTPSSQSTKSSLSGDITKASSITGTEPGVTGSSSMSQGAGNSTASPLHSISSWAGWNASSPTVGSANPTLSAVNATTAPSPSGGTTPALSTPSTVSSMTGITGTDTVPSTTSHNYTQTSSATVPAKPSNGTFTPVTGNITGSATTVGVSEVTAITSAVSLQPSSPGMDWSSTSPSSNSTTPMSTFPAANFTSVTRTAAITRETCYQLAQDPQGDAPRRSLMRNANLHEQNATIPSPYIESVDFESEGIDPLWLTVRDSTESTHYLDISNKSQIAIVDRDGTSMKLDAHGIYFSTGQCRYDISITISNLLGQLSALSGVECSTGAKIKKRLSDLPFTQTLVLRDQCGNPVRRSIRSYPRLSVGTSECTEFSVKQDTGTWEFDCTFPGSESGTLRCQAAIEKDLVDFLTTDPFGGACPDLSTVITTLGSTGKDFLSEESLQAELFAHDLSDEERSESSRILESYQRKWQVLQELFAQNDSSDSALETYLKLYSRYRDFPTDVCEDLHAGEIPLNLSLRAGASRFVINTLNFAPENTIPQKVTVQDPANVACCALGSVSSDQNGLNGTCGYPVEALVRDSGCVCGKTARGGSVAFENTECKNFVGRCETDQDCSDDGHSGFVCMIGTCCGGGVCVDPYVCSENGTQLVTQEFLLR